MNEYQEALDILFMWAINSYCALECGKDCAEYLALKELVDKATPKKPIILLMKGFEEEAASHMCCPNCEQPIVNVWSKAEYKPKYCHYCSQAIDWSGEDEK